MGRPRVHAELRLGEGIALWPQAGRAADAPGRHRTASTGVAGGAAPAATRTPSRPTISCNRAFDPTEPDRLWMMDVTEHPTGDGKVYLAVVLDAFSRRVVGWSIADHIRAELVVDALQMAIWRRQPAPGPAVAHSDHGAQYTSLGVRAAPPSRRPARLDGLHRRLLRQQRRRELLRHPATRAPRRAPLDRPPTARPGDLRLDRSLVQPAPPTQLLRHAQPRRLRSRPHRPAA